MRIITSLLLLVGMCGCAHQQFTRGHGDVAAFIIERSVAYGSVPTTTNGLPSVSDTWRYSEDVHGIIIRMPRDRYTAVEQFLQQAFGSAQSTDGAKLGGHWQNWQTRGCIIQFTADDEGTQIIVLRPLKRKPPVVRQARYDNKPPA